MRLQTFPPVVPPQLAATALPVRYLGGARAATEGLVWHATAGASIQSSVEWMNRWGADRAQQGWASYHFAIERDGTLYAMVPIGRIAYHAGLSDWPDRLVRGAPAAGRSLNPRTIGVAFANRDVARTHAAYEAITDAQRQTALTLAAWLAGRYPALAAIAAHVRHRDIAPNRRADPSPAVLDWGAFVGDLAAALQPARRASRAP